MKPHKWAKEIKAWADGAEIEWRRDIDEWQPKLHSHWYDNDGVKYRIKPQPKEPQYLYVFSQTSGHKVRLSISPIPEYKHELVMAKIKLEVDDD